MAKYATNAKSVKARYVTQSTRAVPIILGRSFSRVGPVNSARANVIPPPNRFESVNTPTITTPMPPIHWEADLRRRIPCNWEARQSSPTLHRGLVVASMTVAPVVVTPELDSKMLWTRPLAHSLVPGPWNVPLSHIGMLMITTARGHANATEANASRSRSLAIGLFIRDDP